MKLADVTNTDGSGCAPSTTPQIQKKKITLGEAVKARRRAAGMSSADTSETPWTSGT